MEPGTIELADYMRFIWKRRLLIVGITVISVLGAGVSSLIQPKTYRAKVMFMVEVSRIPSEKDDFTVQINPQLFNIYTRTYEKAIENKSLLQQAIERFHLDEAPYTMDMEDMERIVSVKALKNTKLVEMTVDFPDGRLAADIANFLADSAVELSHRDREDLEFFKKELDSARAEMEVAEKRLVEFEKKAQLPVLRKRIEVLLSRKGKIEEELLQLNVSIAEKEVYLEKIREELAHRKPTMTLSRRLAEDPAYQQTLAQLSGSDVEEIFNLNMEVEVIDGTYKHLEKQMVDAASLLGSLYARKQASKTELERNATTLNRLLAELTDKETELKRLKMSHDIAVDSYRKLESRFNEASVRAASITPSIWVVSPAIPPARPFKPNIWFNIAVAGGAGFVFSLLVAFMVEYLNNVRRE